MLAKKYRLKRKSEFNYIYKKGTSSPSPLFVLLFAKNRNGKPKVGFVVSKKVGNSVKRNRIKRLLRSSFYSILGSVKNNYNYVFIARQGITELKSTQLSPIMQKILSNNNLIKGE